MTGPYQYPQYEGTLGATSPLATQEWNMMLNRRNQLLDDIFKRLQLGQTLGNQADADAVANHHQAYGTNADGSPTQFQEYNRPPTHEETNQLLGAADFWGIPNADQLDPHKLKQIIEAKRLSAAGDRNMNPLADIALTSAAAMGLGVTQDLIAMAQHIPFIGNAIAESHTVQRSSQWLHSLNEGVQAGMFEDERSGYRIAHGLGGMLGYVLPGEAAWRAAGAVGGIGALSSTGAIGSLVTNPLGRAAIRGAVSTWMLEGGGDQSNEEAAWKVGLGAAGGVVLGELLPRAFEKVKRFFPAKSDVFAEPDIPLDRRSTASPGSNTVDAEWYFEADHQLGNRQGLLGDGGPGQGVPPGGGPPRGLTGEVTPPPDWQSSTVGTGAPEYTGAIDPSIRVAPPAAEPTPIGPEFQLMSPERAAQADRINGLVEQRDLARRLMETDQLTGLGNKPALVRAQETVDADPELGWAVFDGKQFKAVNDTHGHLVGDRTLQNFGVAIQQAAAEMQIPARAFRQGGDEFAAVVPRDMLDQFTRRVEELSYQRIGGVETRLQGYGSDNFAEADLRLMQNKRLSGPADLPSEDGISRLSWDEIMNKTDEHRAFEQFAIESGAHYFPRAKTGLHEPNVPDLITQGNLDTTEALTEASNLTKQAQLIDSVTLPEVAAAAELTPADVVHAAISTNPGRIHVVKGIGEPANVVRELVQGQVQGRIMPHQFRLVERNGQLDMLVSDGMAISNKRANQYRQHGLFEGMQVSGGYLVDKVPAETGGLVRLKDWATGQLHHVPAEQVMPGNYTDPGVETVGENATSLYDNFRSYVEQYMRDEAAKLPAGAKVDTSWLSSETSSQLPRLFDAWYSDGPLVESQISKAAVESLVNAQRARDFQSLVPEEIKQTYSINKELDQIRSVRPIEKMPIEDIASTKGFAFLNDVGKESGVLVDQLSDLRVPVENEDAAYEFLRNFNREVPDYTPASEVPPEAFGISPHSANPGTTLDPVSERGAEHEIAAADRVTQDIEAIIDAVESGQGDLLRFEPALTQPPGGGPPPPRDFSLAGGGMDALPSGPRSLGDQFAEAQRTRPQDLYRVLQKFDSAWLRFMTPFRSATIALETDLKNIGITEGTLWKHYNQVTNAVTVAHNEALPWQTEYADIMSNFRRKLLRTGEVTRIQELVGYNQQLEAMRRAGYNQHEVAAQKRLADFNDRFFRYLADDPAYNIDDSRYIAGYMSHVRQRQGMPGIADPFRGADDILPSHLKFFAEMAREGNMQFRQMDARVLGVKMIRAAMFKKFVGEPYAEMAHAWSDPRIPTEFRETVHDWLQVVRTGHNPNYDVAIQGVRHTLNALGIPVTNGEVATLSNTIFGNMYRAQLGGRPDAIFRDAIQPLLSGVRVGFTPIAKAYNTFLSGGETTQAMIQRGLEGGWLEKGQAKVANADVFEQGVQTPEGTQLLTPGEQARREFLAKIGDMTWAMTPRRLRNGLQGTVLDPLHYYTKLGEVNRLISGEAGYQVAADAITEYMHGMGRLSRGEIRPAEGVMWVDTADKLMADLMKASKAQAYPRPIQDEFRRLVENGQVTEAANLLGNESANSQFRYGAKENPIGIRKAGNVGRAVMQFGTFTTQYVALMREMLMDPAIPVAEKMAMGTRYAAITAALGVAGAYTGWNFSKWMWHQSLTFAGGPLFQGLYSGLQAASGAFANAIGAPQTPAQYRAVESFQNTTPADVLQGAAGSVFPYTSTFRTIDNTVNNLRSANPVEGTARSLITGQQGVGPDLQQWWEQRSQNFADSLAAHPPASFNGQIPLRNVSPIHHPGAGAQ